MRFIDLLKLVYSNLGRMRGRVIMTAMGVVIGTSAIVVLIALSNGLQENTVNSFSSFGALNQITVFSGSRFGGGESTSTTEGLTPAVLKDLKDIPGVVAITPYENLNAPATLKLNRLEGFSNIVGVDPLVVPKLNWTMEKGTDLLARGTVVVGAQVANSFSSPTGGRGARRGGRMVIAFGPMGGGGKGGQQDTETTPPPEMYGQTLMLELQKMSNDGGGTVSTKTARLRVGGVIKATGGNEDYNVYMSIADVTELQAWSQGSRPNWNKDGYSQVLVIAEEDPKVTLQVTEEITNRGYFAISTNSIVESLNSTFLIIQAVLGGIASIALLVAAIGIANTMVMSVLERTREIGLMKAIGARNRDILTVFITEAGTIGLLGGLAGLLIGVGLSKVIDVVAVSYLASSATEGGTIPTSVVAIPLWLPMFAIGFSVVIGLAAGIYPAFRAVQLDPVQALRYE